MAKLDCFRCKGKYYTKPLSCGHSYCPVYTKVGLFQTKKLEKDNFVGTAPGVFVGRYGYPNLNLGILAPPEVVGDAELYESERDWGARSFTIEDVLRFRGPLINSRVKNHVKAKPRFLAMSQEVAMAKKAVNVEFQLQKKPVYRMKHDTVETVLGAYANLQKAVLTENPKVDRKVEYVVSDTDLKAVQGITTLYQKGMNENFLTRILSVGTLGIGSNRKLVPTRWSITATDDTIGKHLIKEVKQFPEADYQYYYGNYLGNYFLVLFFPRVWSYELFEMYMPSTLLNPARTVKWTTDYELYGGRKKYVEQTAGGYYASRLPILEKMKAMKRQASVLVIRFTTEEYHTHLGVFVVREAVRKAMMNRTVFASEEEMLAAARQLLAGKFIFNIDRVLRQSKVYQHIKSQKMITEFF